MANKNSGFTLMELMMVVVIIGILGAIAVPSYRSYVVQSRMAEGYVVLESVKKNQINHHTETGIFMDGYLSTNPSLEVALQTILDGGKILTGGADTFEAVYRRTIFPNGEGVGFFLMSSSGGFNEATQTALGSFGSKIMNSNPATGTSCNSVHFARLIDEFGIDTGADNSYDWVLSTAVANFAYPGSSDCVYLVQLIESRSGNYITNPIIKLN